MSDTINVVYSGGTTQTINVVTSGITALATNTAAATVSLTGPPGKPGVVQSVTAADSSIAVGGTAANPTVRVQPGTYALVAEPIAVANLAAAQAYATGRAIAMSIALGR